jgi:hypothetical protein
MAVTGAELATEACNMGAGGNLLLQARSDRRMIGR